MTSNVQQSYSSSAPRGWAIFVLIFGVLGGVGGGWFLNSDSTPKGLAIGLSICGILGGVVGGWFLNSVSTPKGWVVVLFVCGLIGGGVGGWFLHSASPNLNGAISQNKEDGKSKERVEFEAEMRKVQLLISSSQEVREKLGPFLKQEGLSTGFEKDSVLLSALIQQPRPKIQTETLKNTDVRRLVELLDGLEKMSGPKE